MFKKLKDKLAEEVKSSPQRIQQFAQAAQAAVTSASSSISDITNNDLFSIGDNDSQQSRPSKQPADLLQQEPFGASTSLQSNSDLVDFHPTSFQPENQRLRRLSNSSLASDVSFKLPSYESPSMYHLQSDMDVSASEAEERALASPGAAGAGAGLERVSKEQLYAAYRRSHARYGKYRAQYADLARHYKLLERENAKARSVLVETQDKALRRISELKEQCSLEQSAKAHLERALRLDIDEKNIKINALTTKLQILQTQNSFNDKSLNTKESKPTQEQILSEGQLIDISVDDSSQEPLSQETESAEASTSKKKFEKMEQLINKYKESLKLTKEKNAQLTSELQLVNNEMETKLKENDELKSNMAQLIDAHNTIQQLKNSNEDLQNKLNTYDFTKSKELTTLELDLEKEREEMAQLKHKIELFSKKEEEYAISLAENKLSIHKELESKESEIKSLKESLSISKKEIQSMAIIANDYKLRISALEEECSKLNTMVSGLNQINEKLSEKDSEIHDLKQKYLNLEQLKVKADEEYKCLQLQLHQETAEKLAMVDRNSYLEDRNKQLAEENSKKTLHLNELEKDLHKARADNNHQKAQEIVDVSTSKEKYEKLESEIQEERVELVKLQAEIEKLLKNDDSIKSENLNLHQQVLQLKSENEKLQKEMEKFYQITKYLNNSRETINELRNMLSELFNLIASFKELNGQMTISVSEQLSELFKNLRHKFDYKTLENTIHDLENNNHTLEKHIKDLMSEHEFLSQEIHNLKSENIQLKEQNDINNNLHEKYNNLNDEKENLHAELENIKEVHANSEKQIREIMYKNMDLDKENSILKENNSKSQETNEILNQQLDCALKKNQLNDEKIGLLEKENEDLMTKVNHSEQISNTMKAVIEENKELKTKFESIVNNVTELEKELIEVKNSHLAIDQEKEHLNSVLRELEENMQKKIETHNVECQTKDNYTSLQHKIESLLEENNVLKSKCENIKQDKEALYEKVILLEQKCTELQTELDETTEQLAEKQDQYVQSQKQIETLQSENMLLINNQKNNSAYESSQQPNHISENDSLQKYETFKAEYDAMKEDNKRLQSDVEGLQAYLTKISKENSILNDKLREMIATSEHSDHNETQVNSLLENINKLNSDLQSEKVKAEELSRQNALITEENLELKDQLHLYMQNSDLKADSFTSNNYKQQLRELEQQNKSTEKNMIHLQESNQKLRLSNEKLERRLDEALVSLRHLHSLQENTELEYLKNILYEYLTGSGTHSITLAKVLAAVVKFDDTQTNAVLQKEKERQGLLRQLGLI